MNEPMNKVSMSNGEFKTGNRASCLVSSSYINYIYFCFHSTVSSCLFFLYQLHIFLFSFYCLVLSLLLTSITYISVLILLSRLVLSFLFHVTYGFSPYIFEGIVPLLWSIQSQLLVLPVTVVILCSNTIQDHILCCGIQVRSYK
jgi:hypothetical protein